MFDTIANIIRSNSSPTLVRADDGFHGRNGQQSGYIVYEHDGLPGIVYQLLELFSAHKLIKAKDERIQHLLEANNRNLERAREAERQLNVARTLLEIADTHWLWGAGKSAWFEGYQKWVKEINHG